jgi:hypothetical protein
LALPARHRRHDPHASCDDEQTERHVDQEHHAPAEACEIERHQYAAKGKTGSTRKAKHDTVNTEGAAAGFIGEQQMQCRKHLRHHQRRGRALRQPRRDQLRAGLGQGAPQRRRGEAEHAGDENALGAVDVAEPAAGDDQRRVSNEIKRDHRFDLRRARMQFDRNRRDRDIDDEGIDAKHELRRDHDRKHPPAPRCVDRR